MRLLFKSHVLRIVPTSAMKAAIQPECTLFEFEKASPIAYTENDLAKVFAQDDTAVKRSRALFERLDEVALDEEQSRTRLAEYVSGLRGDPLLRDSKNAGGDVLTFSAQAWQALVSQVKVPS